MKNTNGSKTAALAAAIVLIGVRAFADTPAQPGSQTEGATTAWLDGSWVRGKDGWVKALPKGVQFWAPRSAPSVWARKGDYPPRPGNVMKVLIDGEAAYSEVAAALHKAKRFIYATVSYGTEDFVPAPASGEAMFDIFKARAKDGVDVKLVIWNPALKTPDTVPDPSPKTLAGINGGPGTVEARWDKAPGYLGMYHGFKRNWLTFPLWFPAVSGCNHQKTYVMDDGEGGVVAFVGGINPVQSYWDTPAHDSLDARRLAPGQDPVKGLEKTPPLHDVFYSIKGPTAGDVISNFVERYNGASLPHKDATHDAKAPVTPEQIALEPKGIEAQFLRTIAPWKYKDSLKVWLHGDKGIKEMYINVLNASGKGTVVYGENQYFFDHVVEGSFIAAAQRGAKIIGLATAAPDEGTPQGKFENLMEWFFRRHGRKKLGQEGRENVLFLTLGNSRPDPRNPLQTINSETYIHSKTLVSIGPDGAAMTGGSANFAAMSMLYHAEANVAFNDPALIKESTARLWAEHLNIPLKRARQLVDKPEAAYALFKARSLQDTAALQKGHRPPSRVFPFGTKFPDRRLAGINLQKVQLIGAAGASFDLPGMSLADVRKSAPAPAGAPVAAGKPVVSAGKPLTLVKLAESKAADARCSAPGTKCVDSPFDASYARKDDKENLIKAFSSVLRESEAGRKVAYDVQDERAQALTAAFQIRRTACGVPNADKDRLWGSVQATLRQGDPDGKYLRLKGDVRDWVFHTDQNPWLCEPDLAGGRGGRLGPRT